MSRVPSSCRLGIGGPVAAGLVLAATAGIAVQFRWTRSTRRAVARLDAAARAAAPAARFTREELVGLPAPVARYFAFALTVGQPLVRLAQIEQHGVFALRPGAWRAMRAVQHVAATAPGFVWDARITIVPGLSMRVRDGYLGGTASMRAAAAGIVPLVDRRNAPGLAEGALLRWLAEANVVPTALLPSAGVRWTAIDDVTARATIADAGMSVSMDAHFAPDGAITHVRAMRYRDVNGAGVLTPFVGRSSDYRRVAGMMVPHHTEATWEIPEGPHTFWRADLTGIHYQFAGEP